MSAAGMGLTEALGGGLHSKIDAVGSANFSNSFGGAASDPSIEAGSDPVMAATRKWEGLVV